MSPTHGIEIHQDDIYLVTVKEVLKGKISGDDSFTNMQTIISDLPDGGQHANRWHPQSKALYGFDHGIDWLGDEEQKEELNRIVQDGDYGWPYIYADGKFNKAIEPKGMSHEAYAAKTVKTELLYTAHAAPMDLLFYTGSQFPAEYKDDASATMHGSWNRTLPSGYNIVRVQFQNGKPVKISKSVSFPGRQITVEIGNK